MAAGRRNLDIGGAPVLPLRCKTLHQAACRRLQRGVAQAARAAEVAAHLVGLVTSPPTLAWLGVAALQPTLQIAGKYLLEPALAPPCVAAQRWPWRTSLSSRPPRLDLHVQHSHGAAPPGPAESGASGVHRSAGRSGHHWLTGAAAGPCHPHGGAAGLLTAAHKARHRLLPSGLLLCGPACLSVASPCSVMAALLCLSPARSPHRARRTSRTGLPSSLSVSTGAARGTRGPARGAAGSVTLAFAQLRGA
jgi:hypothetical protein